MATISGGEKVQAYLSDMLAKIKSASAVKVGFLAGSTYPNGTPVAMIAAIQNYGTGPRVGYAHWGLSSGGTPARPFFSDMVAEKSGTWGPVLGAALKANDYDAAKALEQTGELIEGQLRQTINDFSGVRLSAATIKRKGFDKALIDSSHMINSVAHKVTT